MSDDILIRRASHAEIDEFKSIDDDACALYDRTGLHLDMPLDHPFARAERETERGTTLNALTEAGRRRARSRSRHTLA